MATALATLTIHAPTRRGGTARVADAYGALGYVVKQPWADPQRIGLLGFHTGDQWRVPVTGDATAYVIGPERFKAVVAFVYSPSCGVKSPMAAPALVINGVLGSRGLRHALARPRS